MLSLICPHGKFKSNSTCDPNFQATLSLDSNNCFLSSVRRGFMRVFVLVWLVLWYANRSDHFHRISSPMKVCLCMCGCKRV